MAFLEVENLRKKYGAEEVLRGVSFSLEKGEVLAIIGSSGGGKTTLLRCLNFLVAPDEGRIRLNGETIVGDIAASELSDAEIRRRRRKMGLVFQSFHLFPQYSVLKNVTLARDLLSKEEIAAEKKRLKKLPKAEQTAEMKAALATRKKTYRAENAKRAMELLEKVGLAAKANSYPYELSGGQSQRAAIARALALSPEILCFDEPTSALDPELTGEVLKVIKGLKSKESTMIIVTHEMAFAEAVADKVIFLSEGEIAECGTPEEVFKNPQNEKTKAFLKKYSESEL